MPNISASGSTSISGSINIQSKTSMTTTGAIIGTTETTLSIPVGTKAFKLQVASSDNRAVYLTIASSVTGTSSAITSFDIAVGSTYEDETLSGSAILLYIKSNKTNTPVQLLLWF